jgi:hypothetical protein
MSPEAVDLLNEVRDGDTTRMHALMDADPLPMSAHGMSDGLREAVEALADEWWCDEPSRHMNEALHRAACFSCTRAKQLRALLAAHPAPETDPTAGEREAAVIDAIEEIFLAHLPSKALSYCAQEDVNAGLDAMRERFGLEEGR